MILKVEKEFSIPTRYHHSKISPATLQEFGVGPGEDKNGLTATILHGVETDEGWRVVANPVLKDESGSDIVFGEILLETTRPRHVLPEAENWIRYSEATTSVPGRVRLDFIGAYVVRGLILVNAIDLSEWQDNS